MVVFSIAIPEIAGIFQAWLENKNTNLVSRSASQTHFTLEFNETLTIIPIVSQTLNGASKFKNCICLIDM